MGKDREKEGQKKNLLDDFHGAREAELLDSQQLSGVAIQARENEPKGPLADHDLCAQWSRSRRGQHTTHNTCANRNKRVRERERGKG